MSQVLEDYYERELAAFADMRRDFSRRYPAEAGRLLPDPRRPVDPHLDRFIEGFALLAGRLHHKLDSEFPELSEAFLQVLYPQLLTPAPSMSIAQFGLHPEAADPRQGKVVPQHTRLGTRPIGEPRFPCRWRTGYPVTLWPIRVTSAQVLVDYFPAGLPVPPRTQAALVLQLECTGPFSFADLELDKLRLYLSGDRQVIANLYEVLFNHALQVVFRSADTKAKRDPIVLPPAECLFQVGFEPEEGLLPLPGQSFLGCRLLTEFLSFREKFLFMDLGGWRGAALSTKKAEVVVFLNRAEENLRQGVTAQTFLLGCTPIINLFEKSAEPLAVTQKTIEYRVVPSRTEPMGMEVITVDSVTAFDPVRKKTIDFQPFYSFGLGASPERYAFWHSTRRASYLEDDRGTEVYLNLVDAEFNPRLPAEAVLHIVTTCSNRDWPVRFQRGGEALFLESESDPALGPIVCLHLPTTPLRPALWRSTYWRLASQNLLNHVSLTDAEEGRQALQEILRLCDFSDASVVPQLAEVNRQVIEGLSAMKSRPALARLTQGPQIAMCRGVEVSLEFDERSYVGVGFFLFACVLERFLGLYAALNSFTQLIAKTKQAEGYFKKWPPRAANMQLR